MLKLKSEGFFVEIMEIYRQRFNGVFDEWKSIESKWKKLKETLKEERLLPAIEKPVGSEIQRYFQAGKKKFRVLDKELKKSNANTLTNESYLGEISRMIGEITRMVYLLKMGFYQRTVSVELPYVIAGLPKSMEREIGNEMFLLAADNTIRNYLNFIKMQGQEWDHFASYYPMSLEYEILPGAYFLPLFGKTFHIALSEDMKYFLQGFMALAHEVGHAACETRYARFHSVGIPLPIFSFLMCIFQYRRLIRKAVFDATQINISEKRCKEWQCEILRAVKELNEFKDFNEFFKKMMIDKCVSTNLLDMSEQILADIIAMQIAGPNCSRLLFDYSFDEIVSEEEEPELSSLFSELFIRSCACTAYAKAREFPWKSITDRNFERIENKAKSSIEALKKDDFRSAYSQCLACSSQLGFLLGIMLAKNQKEIIDDVLKPNSLFLVDHCIEDDILNEKIVNQKEPRQILNAYFELLVREKKVDSASALFSIANSKSLNLL